MLQGRCLGPLFAVVLLSLAGCATHGLRSLEPAEATARLENALNREARRGFAGQALVARGDEVLLLAARGKRRPGGDEPIAVDAVMPLASVTKPFTASAVLALVEDGHVALDAPLGAYLGDLADPWAQVPVEHFLLHTAGLPAEIVNRTWPGHPWFEPVGHAEFLAGLARFPPDHPPGDGFNYSNVGYSILAALIEQVTGLPWERYLRERLLLPARVDDIGFLLPDWPPEQRVHGRVNGEDRGSHFDQPRLDDGLGYRLRGAGDLQASARSMLHWWQSIRRGEWLPRDAFTAWITPQVAEPDGQAYGYGLEFRPSRAGPVSGHSGSDGVFTADWSWYAEHELLIYVASADPGRPANAVRESLLRALLRP